jgi:dipeptidyl aminopeptidase/acylaminoacyl peptidase
MKMSRINNQKNHARQLLGLALATAMLTSLFAVTSYSGTRPRSSSAAKTNAATVSRTQPQTIALKQNGKIAFVSNRAGNDEIYVMDADGGNQTRLTDNSALNLDPAFSPDGTKIAFTSYRDDPKAERSEIYVMNADGSNQKRLTNSPDGTSNSQPAWSPDGGRIAYVYGVHINVINADGSGQTTIAAGLFPISLAWSPDNTKIAFSAGSADFFFSSSIYVMSADGSVVTPLAESTEVLDFYSAPAWSPDGAKLAFGHTRYDFFSGALVTAELRTMNLDGSNEQFIAAAAVSAVSWSPDGEKIAFDNFSAGNNNITIVNINGSNSLQLTNNQGSNYHPSWGPQLSPPGPNTVQFSSSSYTVSEGSPRVDITLSRTGDTTSSASVTFATNDGAGLTDCNVINGIASPRCDYINTFGTMSFAAGQTSKAFSIAIVDDSYAEGNETFTINLSGASAATLGTQSTATVTITDNDSSNGPNPIDSTDFFVRQQYIDLLGREPDPPGFAGWTSTINNCTGDTTQCDRIHVSQQFFQSPEFQTRGYFVYRFYPVAFGRKPDYGEFVPDLARVSGFLDANQLESAKVQFIADFIARPAFTSQYNSLDNTAYVDALINIAAVNLSNRQALIDSLNNNAATRAQVLRQIVESSEVSTKYNHQAYAVMEYFGYLRRQPDALYLDWITVLDSTNDPRAMVNGFVSSTEYRQRFGL